MSVESGRSPSAHHVVMLWSWFPIFHSIKYNKFCDLIFSHMLAAESLYALDGRASELIVYVVVIFGVWNQLLDKAFDLMQAPFSER